MRGYKRFLVFPERVLRATRIEVAVVDTRALQRLRYVSQLGQSHISYPTAEHSRFAHSLGALYWSGKMLSYLRENFYFSTNQTVLDSANETLRRTLFPGISNVNVDDLEDLLEVSLFDQLVRLVALTHDVTHIPFGHTLEDQAGLLPRHDEDNARIDYVFASLHRSVQNSPHLAQQPAEMVKAADALLEQCRVIQHLAQYLKETDAKDNQEGQRKSTDPLDAAVPLAPYLTLASDIVNNTICADLIDYVHRDTLGCSMPWTLDKALLTHLKVLELKPPSRFRLALKDRHGEDTALPTRVWRLGIGVRRNSKLRHDVLTAALGLLRARYDITEKVYYHHAKCAADAMLEKVLRLERPSNFSWESILEANLGDEGLLNRIETTLKDPGAQSVLKKLRDRRLFKMVYRIRRGTDWSRQTKEELERCKRPEGRSELERRLFRKLEEDMPVAAIVASYLPDKMQLKEAEALVEWPDGEILKLAELSKRKNYLAEVVHLTERYRDLWTFTVYLDGDSIQYWRVVERACEQVFGRQNDPLVHEYLAERFPMGAVVSAEFEDIVSAAERDTINDANVAMGGGDPSNELDLHLLALESLADEVSRRQAAAKRRSSKQRSLLPEAPDDADDGEH